MEKATSTNNIQDTALTNAEENETYKQQSGKEHEEHEENVLIERHNLEGTPFTLVRVEKEWSVVIGEYKLNEIPFKSKKEAEENAKKITWDRIVQVVTIAIEGFSKLKQIQKEEIIDEITK